MNSKMMLQKETGIDRSIYASLSSFMTEIYLRAYLSMLTQEIMLLLGEYDTSGNADSPDAGQAGAYRSELTEEELEKGHASFQIQENLVVDAYVTAQSVYVKGFASYYSKAFCETDEDGEGAFRENPTVSGNDFQEWEKLLNQLQPGKFKEREFILDIEGKRIRQEYIGDNGMSYSFSAFWGGIKKDPDEGTAYYTPVILLNADKNHHTRECAADHEASGELAFLQNIDEKADEIKGFLEEMSGRRIHDRYDIIPEGESVTFLFYYDIHGLPFKNIYRDVLASISERAQKVTLDKDGLVRLECSNMRHIESIYKKCIPVITPNEVLKQLKIYYGRGHLAGRCVISNIELIYTGCFSDGSEGEVRPVIAPFWIVIVQEDEDGKQSRRVRFTYDAYTGRCIQEAVIQLS